jgi:PAS domain S-box-containing protein
MLSGLAVLSVTLGVAAAACAWHALALRRRLAVLERGLERETAARRSAEERLTENQCRLRTIIESEPECVKLQARDGTILEMNPAGLAFSDADQPDQIVGKSVYPLIAPEHRESYRALSESVFAGRAAALEFRLVSLKGRERLMETHAVPLRNAAGEITALLGLTRDVTERKRAEEQARRHLAELARVARVSTMGEMASGIAHELNQPLAAIANHAAACQRRAAQLGGLAPAVLESLDEIAAQARRAGQIIRNLRELAQKGTPCRTAVDVNGVVRLVAEVIEPEARHRAVRVRLGLDEKVPLAFAEKIEIEQVILNLVKNSIEAMDDPATVAREVEIATGRGAGGTVEISVRDTGPGIPDEFLEQVFDPFFTTKADGMGMGLSISRSIVESHGGRFAVWPNPDRGVTLRFTLPAYAIH